MQIRLPYPALLVLVGPSGAGKTTFSRRFFSPTQIVSSDECRRLVADTDSFHPSRTAAAFRLYYFLVEERLRLGRLTVADSTGLLRRSRAPLLAMCRRYGIPAWAVVFNQTMDRCLSRDRVRGRQVGRRILERQFRELQVAQLALPYEDFEGVITVDAETEPQIEVLIAPEELMASAAHSTPKPGKPGSSAEIPRPAEPRHDVLKEARVQLAGGMPGEAAIADARHRIAAAPADLAWQVTIPMPIRALSGGDARGPENALERAAGWLESRAFGRGLFRAHPAGIPATGLFGRTPEDAADLLGATDGRREALLAPGWPGASPPELSHRLAEIHADLLDCTAYWRLQSDFIALDFIITVSEDVPGLVPMALNFPAPQESTDHIEFFWDWLEINGFSTMLVDSQTRLANRRDLRSPGFASWWHDQAAAGREITLACATRQETETDPEIPWIGWDEPSIRLFPRRPAEETDVADTAAQRLFVLRRLAQRALAAKDATAARTIIQWAWALQPHWRAAAQRDLFD